MLHSASSDSMININCMGFDKTQIFAADELKRYLSRMIKQDVSVKINPIAQVDDSDINLAVYSALPFLDLPNVDDIAFDDSLYIDIDKGAGYISGSNPRSVLLAVYRFLTEIGCRWVRPGADGEYIPELDSLPDVHVCESASYRHRGVCIEGAVSYQHVRDMVDWIPKLGFNAYFTQFREGFAFFDRWYSHQGNPIMEGKQITLDDARRYISDLVCEIGKRGLIYHAVGHGWTCEPLGIPGMDWEQREYTVPPESVQYMAQVDGVRGLWGNIPLNTNLCYSNPKVREIITDEIVDYLKNHPWINALHFWLADGSNNNCECDECKKALPSDFYVKMLNELDAKLSAADLSTKIVFLIYVDLLWPPEVEKFVNKDRFILMFAPITRTYSEAFAPAVELPEIPPYNRNKLEFTRNVDMNVSFLKEWQSLFEGDSFDFDYHLMWDYANDPGFMQISDIISKDMKALKSIGLNGFVSCQIQRIFMPTALPMTVMGKTLWNTDVDISAISDDYFKAAFGNDWKKSQEYLQNLSELFDPVYLRGEKQDVSPEASEKINRIPALINEFIPTIETNISCENVCHRKSWDYLKYHADICIKLAEALKYRAQNENEKAQQRWQDVKQMIWKYEPIIHPVFDVQNFINVMGRKFV